MGTYQKTAMPIGRQAEQNGFRAVESPVESDANSHQPPFGNKTLSVVIRCHKVERLPFLEEAIFSLSIQEWTDLEIIIVIQNGNADFVREVREIIVRQPWREEPRVSVHAIEFRSDFDGRSSLLNHGIKHSIGRYLAFLDDDDVIYHHGYTTLIEKLSEEKGAAVAVGGCRVAKTLQKSTHWFINAKETPFVGGRTRYDLFRDNFIPIHSYVIDRAIVNSADLYFDDDLPPLEDYDFLLRLSSKYEFDFSSLDVFVCEYRIHNSNSIPYTADATQEQVAKYQRAYQLIEERKKNLMCLIPLPDIIALRQPLPPQTEEFPPLPLENPQIIRRVVLLYVDKIYAVLHNYPRLEKKLSSLVHRGWKFWKPEDAVSSE